MKLHELGAQRPTEQIAKTLGQRLGDRVDFDRLRENQARRMLQRVKGLLREYRSSPSRHFAERNPDYLRLMMLEQALAARVSEQQIVPGAATSPNTGAVGAAVTDPKTKAVMDKVKRGQPLTADEQQTMNKIAMTKEAKRARRMVRESEIQTAQVVLAAQDMIDRIQKMMEEISEMQFKDLPALTDSIKNDMGVEQSQSFQQQAAAALTTLLQAVQAGKTEMESAQGVLTGQAPVVPGAADMEPGSDVMPPAGDDLGADLGAGEDLPPPEEEDEELAAVSLGRERR